MKQRSIENMLRTIATFLFVFILFALILTGCPLKANYNFLILRADVEKAVDNELTYAARKLETNLKKQSIAVDRIHCKTEQKLLVMHFPNKDMLVKARRYIEEKWDDMDLADSGELSLSLKLTKRYEEYIRMNALRQVRKVIEDRIEDLVIQGLTIHTVGPEKILIFLPREVDTKKVKNRIFQPAVLEFKLVKQSDYMAHSKEELLKQIGGSIPDGYDIYPSRPNNQEEQFYYLLNKTTDLSGKYIIDARVGYDKISLPSVEITFDEEGAQKFAELTSNNINKILAIVLDDVVISAPLIRCKIKRRCQITGYFTYDEAEELAILLLAGSFPVPVVFVEESERDTR